jgi:glycogen debranching enzyme
MPEQMWRGPVWININYFFIEALFSCGQKKLAEELRDHTLSLVTKNEGIYEYYNPETGTVPPGSAPMFGWSAALYIDLVIQASTR